MNEGRTDLYDRLMRFISRILPAKLVYFATLRLFAYATTGKYSDQVVSELLAMEALNRWEEK